MTVEIVEFGNGRSEMGVYIIRAQGIGKVDGENLSDL
jgi:hypothetical protein